jgi:hypothetical protein
MKNPLLKLMTLPVRMPLQVGSAMMQAGGTVAARVTDAATGGDKVNIDTTHHVPGDDPGRWADRFLSNPSKISPLATGARKEQGVMTGSPFPGGPRIGVETLHREDKTLADGRKQTILDVRYHQAFEGPGRITVTQGKQGGLDVRDEWNDVENHSFLPSRAAEVGHPLVAGMGFAQIGEDS